MKYSTVTLDDEKFLDMVSQLDLSVAGFARAIGMSEDHVSKIRAGHRGVSMRFVAGTYDAFGVEFPHEIYVLGKAGD